eukprot:scpid51087/ scgid25511/ tRNA (guanine(37)-N1)-methyltransferase; M1G-methyltransferase; tRNA [GM37] methyltransferase; tRNA methyltransferase 5 homolog
MELFLPPESVRGMTSLVKESFSTDIAVQGINVPKKKCQEVVKALRKNSQCLKVSGVAPVREIPDDANSMLVLLMPGVDQEKFPASVSDLLASGTSTIRETQLTIGFNNFSTTQLLDSILPKSVPRINAFATIGHMAHINLRREQEPYKSIIGEVILAKNQIIRTVVNKTHSINNTFRTFNMEVLAGEQDTLVTHNENGCMFKFDFAKVFWNSRLCGEHQRIVEQLSRSDVVCDVFAGVGPFVIPAAKRGCRVYANDLNSESTASLTENCRLNHVASRVSVFTLDGRQFLKEISAKVVAGRAENGVNNSSVGGNERTHVAWPMFNHVVMNLPAIAIEFLDAFRGAFTGHDDVRLPMVHCYCFSSADNPHQEVLERVKSALGVKELGDETKLHEVRSVAISSRQYCVSFRLPREAAMAEPDCGSDEPDAKRARVDT